MKSFIQKIFRFAIPLLLIFAIPIGSFFIMDPFKILKTYDKYPSSPVSYNEDYIVTERFLKNKDKLNSFMFGSSRLGCGFEVADWKNVLGDDNQTYAFAAANESIFGIHGKVKMLDKMNIPIKNAFILVDTDVTMRNIVNSDGHIFIKHPLVSGEGTTPFIAEYLKNYIFTGFFVRYLDYTIFKKQRKYMLGFLNFNRYTEGELYTPFNLDWRIKIIEKDPTEYYSKKFFYKRPDVEQSKPPKGSTKCKEFFTEIKEVFAKHNTSYKIAISPLYDQKRIHKKDLEMLTEIFGEENVFDFSGKNEITSDKQNYYETSHFKAEIGKEIIEGIYGGSSAILEEEVPVQIGQQMR